MREFSPEVGSSFAHPSSNCRYDMGGNHDSILSVLNSDHQVDMGGHSNEVGNHSYLGSSKYHDSGIVNLEGLGGDPKVVVEDALYHEQSGLVQRGDFAKFLLSHLQSKGQNSLFFNFHSSAIVSALDLCRNLGVAKVKLLIHDKYSSSRDPNSGLGVDQNQCAMMRVHEVDDGRVFPLEVDPLAIGSNEERRVDMCLLNSESKEFVTPSKLEDLGYRLLLKGVEERDERCISDWVFSKMDKFGSLLGLSFEGCETEARELFCLIERNRMKGRGAFESRSVESKRLKSELVKLESGINYEHSGGCLIEGFGRKGKGLIKK